MGETMEELRAIIKACGHEADALRSQKEAAEARRAAADERANRQLERGILAGLEKARDLCAKCSGNGVVMCCDDPDCEDDIPCGICAPIRDEIARRNA